MFQMFVFREATKATISGKSIAFNTRLTKQKE